MDLEKEMQLRSEIVASQKIQADYLKWKLITVAALSAVALGINPSIKQAVYLLCVVPLCCFYTDLLSLHTMIRIVTIGNFLKKEGCKYEEYIDEIRQQKATPLKFENYALICSSVFFNLIPVIYGLVQIISFKSTLTGISFIISGIVGILLTMVLVLRINRSIKTYKNKSSSS